MPEEAQLGEEHALAVAFRNLQTPRTGGGEWGKIMAYNTYAKRRRQYCCCALASCVTVGYVSHAYLSAIVCAPFSSSAWAVHPPACFVYACAGTDGKKASTMGQLHQGRTPAHTFYSVHVKFFRGLTTRASSTDETTGALSSPRTYRQVSCKRNAYSVPRRTLTVFPIFWKCMRMRETRLSA